MDSEGLTGYHSVIAVKADSPYQSLDDLKGKTLAYADPNSTSGYLPPPISCASLVLTRRPFSDARALPGATRTAFWRAQWHLRRSGRGGRTRSAAMLPAWKARR